MGSRARAWHLELFTEVDGDAMGRSQGRLVPASAALAPALGHELSVGVSSGF